MKRILVTGCAGFIGSHVVDLFLKNKYRVTGIDNFDNCYSKITKLKNLEAAFLNPGFEFHEMDVCDADQMMSLQAPVDVVIHLAAKAGIRSSISEPASYMHTNITGTQQVLEWMRMHKIKKFIFASSSSVYGATEKDCFQEEDCADTPLSPYAFSKRAGELLNYTYHNLYNIDVINLRFFTVYGERQRPDMAIHKFVKQMLEEKPLHVYGNGKRDYNHVSDIVNGVFRSVEFLLQKNSVFETINLGSGYGITTHELINLLGVILNVKPTALFLPKQNGEMDLTVADTRKAKALLGHSAETDLESGLEKFINWYSSAHHLSQSLKYSLRDF